MKSWNVCSNIIWQPKRHFEWLKPELLTVGNFQRDWSVASSGKHWTFCLCRRMGQGAEQDTVQSCGSVTASVGPVSLSVSGSWCFVLMTEMSNSPQLTQVQCWSCSSCALWTGGKCVSTLLSSLLWNGANFQGHLMQLAGDNSIQSILLKDRT